MIRLRKPDFRYLATCTTLEEAKKTYRQKAQELHPDRPAGSLVEMQQLNIEWDYIVKAKPQLPVQEVQFSGYAEPRKTRRHKKQESSFNANDMFSGFEAFKRAAEMAEQERAWRREQEAKHYKEQKTRQQAERPKTVNRVELDYDVAKVVIDSLLEEAVRLNKLKGSIYFSFVNFIKDNNHLTNRKQLEYMAVKLGYAIGWAFYKSEALKQEGLI